MRLIYFPLEIYEERYTYQLSRKGGWFETKLRKENIPFIRIEGMQLRKEIKDGVALDAISRSYYAMDQLQTFLLSLDRGLISQDDVLYFEDIWHPGIECLPYIYHIKNMRLRAYAFCHAQSVDIHDFTHPMRHWMRHIEIGYGKFLEGIFVNCSALSDLLSYAGIGRPYVVRHVFDPVEVAGRADASHIGKEKQVVFSSRWDKEKNPDFFIDVFNEVHKTRKDIKFIVCTSAKRLRSNDQELVKEAYLTQNNFPDHFLIKENLSKEEYYLELAKSKVQFNCADQDFVSYALLEAVTLGCSPCYPDYLSFPEALHYNYDYMYSKGDVVSAKNKLISLIDNPTDADYLKYIVHPHTFTVKNMIKIMKDNNEVSELV